MTNTEKVADNIIKQVKEYGDTKLIKDLYKKLSDLLEDQRITVRYAGELTEKQKVDVQNYIAKKIDANSPVDFVNDEKLLGGMIIEYKDYLLDYSLKTKINKLKSKHEL